jgi:methylenetetrahydrofolate--tRNA-(uracil-5-)-methyltransferase
MNVNFGLFPPLPEGAIGRHNKGDRRPMLARRALADLDAWLGRREAAA